MNRAQIIQRLSEHKGELDAFGVRPFPCSAGGDATWNGFDDEAIYIYPKKGQGLSIFPKREKLATVTYYVTLHIYNLMPNSLAGAMTIGVFKSDVFNPL